MIGLSSQKTCQRGNSDRGRLSLIRRLSSGKSFRVSIGSADTRLAELNLDIDKKQRPDIVADARNLPLQPEIADEVLFTDVIEHLPIGSEICALAEISRILRQGGKIIISTPNARPIFKFLDPSWYASRHRHYPLSSLQKLIENAGLTSAVHFESGFIATMLGQILSSVFIYRLERLFHIKLQYAPRVLQRMEEREYRMLGRGRYTIFVIAKKEPSR